MRIIKIIAILIFAGMLFFVGFTMPLYILEYGIIKTLIIATLSFTMSMIWLSFFKKTIKK